MFFGILFVIYQIYSLQNSITINNSLIIIDLIWILYDIYLDETREKMVKNDATTDINFVETDKITIGTYQKYNTFLYLFFNIFWFPISFYFINRNSVLKYFRTGYYFLIVYWTLSELIPCLIETLKPENLKKIGVNI